MTLDLDPIPADLAAHAGPRDSGARNVRNWWLHLDVDGRARVATGPAAKDGGFSFWIAQRRRPGPGEPDGDSVTALRIFGFAQRDGTLRLSVADAAGREVATLTTNR